MKELIAQARIEMLGDAGSGWREFDVRLPGQKVEIGDLNVRNRNKLILFSQWCKPFGF
jgi:hypothetical protein